MKLSKAILLCLFFYASFAQSQTKITQETLTFYDSSRSRKLVTEIWSPVGNSNISLPLIMFSHGTGGNRLACSWFCEGLAQKGFMVAAVDHFGNTYDNPIPSEFVSIWKRPQDISFVLTELLDREQFAGRINQEHIFVAGFSLGGYTSLAVAGAKINAADLIKFFKSPRGRREIEIPEMPGLINLFEQDSIKRGLRNNAALKDSRIRGALAMAPAAGQGFSSVSQMQDVDIPVFIMGIEWDSIAPVETNARHYRKLLPQARWHLIEGKAGHYVLLNVGNEEMQKAAPVYFSDDTTVNRSATHSRVLLLAEEFFKTLLK